MLAAKPQPDCRGASIDITLYNDRRAVAGLGAIVACRPAASRAGSVEVADLQGQNAAKALLDLGHSVTCASFAKGSALASRSRFRRAGHIHHYGPSPFTNIPRGLAMRWGRCPARISVFVASVGLWAISTAFPRPIFIGRALILFVETFRPFPCQWASPRCRAR